MGQLIDGTWHTGWYDPDQKGRFVRPATRFHGRAHAVKDRYHLYISWACPWASRIALGRALRGLQDALPMTVVNPKMGDDGWRFGGYPGAQEDPLHGAAFLRELYVRADPHYTGRVTVPVLWDKQQHTIVNNESRQLLRQLGDRDSLGAFGDPGVTLCPEDLREEVDRVIDALYEPVNNGVYRCGFAGSQEAYEEACRGLFEALDHWEQVLGRGRYLLGDRLTEADVCLYTTLVRFDLVYHGHFKCNVQRIQDYPNLWGYLRDLYQTPAFRETTDLEHIKVHYYWSQPTVNPSRIVPLGPTVPLDLPHDRG
jgi:putative glutathione S-transferase